jgi:ACR3 family arsenite efflux pump ArsB
MVKVLALTSSSSTAVGLLVMMYPILCKVRYESLHHAFRSRQIWIQLAFSIIINWVIAPFLMVCVLIVDWSKFVEF